MEKIKTMGFFSLFSPFPELFNDPLEVIYEAQRKQAEWADLVKVSEMHYSCTRYQPTVSLTAMAIKNAALSHLKGIWVTDILINNVPISQHQVCSLHNFSLLEWMEIGVLCYNDSAWNVLGTEDSSQEEPRLENDGLSHFRRKKSGGSGWQKAGWGQPDHTSHKEWSQNPWVYQNIRTWKQVSGWDGLKRWNWGQSLSQKSGKDHGNVNDSGS